MEIHSVDLFIDYYRKIRLRTRRVVDCIPPERIEWRHREGKFSLGDLIRHLAALERWMFAENIRGRPSCYPGHGRELADGHAEVLAYFDEMHRQTLEILRGLSDDDLERRCRTPGGAELAVWKWLRAMVEHEVHHRGQIYLMLGMLDVPTPPLYGLTSEEVYDRSKGGGN